MRHVLFIIIVLFAFLGCKKKEQPIVEPDKPVADTKTKFVVSLLESTGKPEVPGFDVFYIKFFNNNNLVSTTRINSNEFKVSLYPSSNIITECSYNFELSNLAKGTYTCEISDSLNLYGIDKKSIVLLNNNPAVAFNLGTIEKKPLFTIQNYQVGDTLINGYHTILLKFYTASAMDGHQLAVYIGKNAGLSKSNYTSANAVPLYNQWFSIHNNYTSNCFSEIGLSTYLPGDSIYFAVYPASNYFTRNSVNYLKDPFEFNALGDQKVLIGYKIH